MPYQSPVFGWTAQWMSELGQPGDLDALLAHADTFLNPLWSDGGLHYQRNDAGWDMAGNYVYVDAHTSNAAIGYARLNVVGGQKSMWDKPWTRSEVDARPTFGGVGLELGVDCLRADWDETDRCMVATFKTWDASTVRTAATISMLPVGVYGVYLDGKLVQTSEVPVLGHDLTVLLAINGHHLDLVVLHE